MHEPNVRSAFLPHRIRGRALLVATILLMAALAAPTAPVSAAEGPSPRPWHDRDRLFDVEIRGDKIWVVGHPGVILHSTDRGATWIMQEGGGDEALYAIQFVDDRIGFIVGRSGLVLRTDDGGGSWVRQESNTHEPLMDVSFVDDKYGWAVGNFATIIHTSDGGATWTPQLLAPEDDPVLNGVVFIDRQRGWVAGEFGTIARTSDGGIRWEYQETGTERALFGFAFDEQGRRATAVGSGGAVVTSTDGGATWRTAFADVPEPLLHVAFAENDWLSCGRSGMVVFPSNGELHTHHSGTYVWLASLDITSDGFALAVGAAGTMLKSVDAGRSWQPLEAVESR